MLIETDAVVISTFKYSESSLIARCYCKELGLKSFMLKGILSSKKGPLKSHFFNPEYHQYHHKCKKRKQCGTSFYKGSQNLFSSDRNTVRHQKKHSSPFFV